jgi:hypothetical protein
MDQVEHAHSDYDTRMSHSTLTLRPCLLTSSFPINGVRDMIDYLTSTSKPLKGLK